MGDGRGLNGVLNMVRNLIIPRNATIFKDIVLSCRCTEV